MSIHEALLAKHFQDGTWNPPAGWKAAAVGLATTSGYDGFELRELLDKFPFRPDAYRLVIEGPARPGFPSPTQSGRWGYPVLVIELLEVEIGHPLTTDKRRAYTDLWWLLDASACFALRVFVQGRYGEPILLTTDDEVWTWIVGDTVRRAR